MRGAGSRCRSRRPVWHDGALTLPPGGCRGGGGALRVRRSAARGGRCGGLLAVDPRTDASLLPRWRKGVRYAAVAPVGCLGRAIRSAAAGPTLIEWGGALRWLRGDQARNRSATWLPVPVATRHCSAERLHSRWPRASSSLLSPVLAKIHRNLKQAFDPAGVFNRGRMYPEF